jgi:hypothetical protein
MCFGKSEKLALNGAAVEGVGVHRASSNVREVNHNTCIGTAIHCTDKYEKLG